MYDQKLLNYFNLRMSNKYHVEVITHLLYLMMDLFIVGEVIQYGQLGLGHKNDQNTPQLLQLENVKQISCGYFHTFALLDDGSVYCWGNNDLVNLDLDITIIRILHIITT